MEAPAVAGGLGPGGLGALVRQHRRATGLSQRELAERCGISVAAVRDLEQERTRSPHPRTVRALVDALALTDTAALALHELATAGAERGEARGDEARGGSPGGAGAPVDAMTGG